ncbi:MAG TPA: protein phosphatase 2C domain-containing protein [Ktedonobacteraceae bacterium]|nr:protein phosphatase 2C domain-containing protein [Ktedonobacteraceae bacterium]
MAIQQDSRTGLQAYDFMAPANSEQAELALEVGARLDVGIKRKYKPNEDSLLVTRGIMPSTALPQPFTLMSIADGMGGLAHGQEASRLATQSLAAYIGYALNTHEMLPRAMLPLLIAGVQHANDVVFQHNLSRGDTMGTTLTATLVMAGIAYVVQVGDSRCYLYRPPVGLQQITRDHSMVALLVEAGIIERSAVYTHPARNQIYRCLGEQALVEVDGYTLSLAANDILLLCSDGLWEMVHDPQLASLLSASSLDPSIIARKLVQAALTNGGEDNISAIVARAA